MQRFLNKTLKKGLNGTQHAAGEKCRRLCDLFTKDLPCLAGRESLSPSKALLSRLDCILFIRAQHSYNGWLVKNSIRVLVEHFNISLMFSKKPTLSHKQHLKMLLQSNNSKDF